MTTIHESIMTDKYTIALQVELENYLKKGPSSMKQIYQIYHMEPALDGMDQARAMRKIRSILNSSSSIVKRGDKRGTVYEYNPGDAGIEELTGLVENELIHLHLKNGGTFRLVEQLQDFNNGEAYNELKEDNRKEATANALNNLLNQRILEIDPPNQTKLTNRFWEHSSAIHRTSTSFTHSTAIGSQIEDLVEQLQYYNNGGENTLPTTNIPLPIQPSRSTAIEVAVVLATHFIKDSKI